MRPLIDFINHGILPFVGRTKELEALERFWRETADGHGMRAIVVLGEAGAGKSRLVEELLPRVAVAGGLIVHTKFYPGTSTSIASLVAAALVSSSIARPLLARDPSESLAATITAVQRLARLRPLLLVIEDLHLLEGDARAELVGFLESIADENVALLCLARPADLASRGVIERYLLDEMRIGGFTRDDVAAIWRRLFGGEIDGGALEALHRATAGNPLALRTALRGAIKTGAIAVDAAGNWRVAAPRDEFASVIESNVTLLAEGMLAHLSLADRRCALQLAALGEIFTIEAAGVMIDDAERVVDVLLFKGILAPPTVAGALLPPSHPSAHRPVAFVHTLLHRQLVEQTPADASRLVHLVASDAPLYSALPYELMSAHAAAATSASLDVVRRAIDNALGVAHALDRTTEWPLASVVLDCAEALVAARAAEWSDEEDRALRIRLAGARLELMRRDNSPPEYRATLDRLTELTADALPDELLTYRLAALRYRFVLVRRQRPEECVRIWSEVDELVRRHAWIQLTESYVDFLDSASQATGIARDEELIARAESRMHEMLAAPGSSEEFRQRAFRRLGPHYLWRFQTEEELAARRRMLEELEAIAVPDDFSLLAKKAAFLQGTGHVDETLAVLDALQPRLRDLGFLRQVHTTGLLRIYALAWRVARIEDLETMVDRAIAEAPPLMRAWMRERAGVHLVRFGLMRNEAAWARAMHERYLGPLAEVKLPPGETRLLLAASEGALERLLREETDLPMALPRLAAVIADRGDASVEALERELDDALSIPILTRDSIAGILNVVNVLELARRRDDLATMIDAKRDDVRRTIERILEWLAARKLAASMRPVLAMTEDYFDSRRRAGWIERIEEMEQQEALAHRGVEPERLRISMLGSIEIQRANESAVKVRGARLRTLLALMTADRLLERPLSLREFQRIASGGEDDPERARKTTSMGVLRLRETIGDDAVSTDGETPALNLAVVTVDLLEADGHLQQVTSAVEDRAWLQAGRALHAALDITAAQVPFPGLYEEFFEAARDDFDYALRTAILNVARGLMNDGDAASAAEVLSRGFEAMPEDEEIVALLRDALTRVGRRTDAERVRLATFEP